jgi:2,5-diamino-6-(ribosylamino)-4(3H)-pyrimidinone 5'-phosphate reductase
MMPEIIIHNQVSLNSYLTGFKADLEIYYQIAYDFKPDSVLVGSDTALSGIKLDCGNINKIPKEKKTDYERPNRDKSLPYLVIPDSRGKMNKCLHFYRRLEFIKDIIVLISDKTKNDYIDYLKKRNYKTIKTGKDHCNYKTAFKILNKEYETNILRSDSGGTLNAILLKEKLVDKISLIISPILVNKNNVLLFENLNLEGKIISLKLIKRKTLNNSMMWLLFKIQN